MKRLRKISARTTLIFAFALPLHAQQADFSNINVSLDSASDLQVMLVAVESVPPVPFADLSRQQKFGTFWSAQHPPEGRTGWPPLPGNIFGLPVWPIGDDNFILDDRNVDYDALQAEADLTAAAALKPGGGQMQMMLSSSFASSYAYSNPVYLTNLVVSSAGYQPMTASFSIGGGTNFVPYDILMTTNLDSPVGSWNWLGIGYTSYQYTFTNQPADMAFYLLAKPSRTMVLAWGGDASGQSDVPLGMTNAVQVSGGLDFSVALKADGTVTAWGDNGYGQTNVPADLTNATVVVAGYEHSLALRTNGTLAVWGSWFNNGNYLTPSLPSGLTNVVAISAGVDHDIAAKADGTVVVWGYTNEIYDTPLPGLSGVKDVEAGWSHNVALLTNGTVVAWGQNYGSLGWNVTNVPSGLSNVVAIAAGAFHTLALKADGTVVAWGAGSGSLNYDGADQGQNIVPTGLSNVVAVAAGGYHSVALKSDGTVVMWGDLSLPSYQLNQVLGLGVGALNALALRGGPFGPPIITSQTPATNVVCIYGNYVPLAATATAPGLTNGFPLAYQWQFDGTNLISATNTSYGFFANDNSSGIYTFIAGNAAGSTNASWQVTVTNAINVANDLLLIYNSNSSDSSNLCAYYLAHRPMVGGANVLGIACDVGEFTTSTNCNAQIVAPVLNWLTNNPTKRPQYVVLFYDIPTRLTDLSIATFPTYYDYGSVGYHLHILRSDWQPFVNYINGGTLADCEAYVDKVANFGTNYSPGQLVISASTGGYRNTNYVLDGIRHGAGYSGFENYTPYSGVVAGVTNGLIAAGVPTNSILFSDGTEIISNGVAYNLSHPTGVTNVTGYICWGAHSSLGGNYPIDETVQWKGNSGWWIIRTLESYNGQKADPGQGNFVKWFSSNAFGGTNYSNTPIGASSNVEEPGLESNTTTSAYFNLWASGKNFGVCVWSAINTHYFQAVGDPFVTR